MASTTKCWLPPFNPAADFVVAAWPNGFTVSGYQPKPGEPFDKTSISPRMLREHYEKRWIAVAENSPSEMRAVEVDPSQDFVVQPSRRLNKAERKAQRRHAAA